MEGEALGCRRDEKMGTFAGGLKRAGLTSSFSHFSPPAAVGMAPLERRASLSELHQQRENIQRAEARSGADVAWRERIRRMARETLFVVGEEEEAVSTTATKTTYFKDLYGFQVDTSLLSKYQDWWTEFRGTVAEREAVVGAFLESPPSGAGDSLVWRGIPPRFRSGIWFDLCGGRVVFDQQREASVARRDAEQIELDLPRTFPCLFETRPLLKGQLRELLQHVVRQRHATGYSQGMSYIGAGLLVITNGDVACSTQIFLHITDQVLRDYFGRSLEGVKVDSLIMEHLLLQKLPRLAAHFESIRFPLVLLVARVVLPLFITTVPSETAFRIWDLVLAFGPQIIFQVMLAILELFQEQLLPLSEIAEVMTKLTSCLAELWRFDFILNRIPRHRDVDSTFVTLHRSSFLAKLQASANSSPPPLLLGSNGPNGPRNGGSSSPVPSAPFPLLDPPLETALGGTDDSPPRLIAKSGAGGFWGKSRSNSTTGGEADIAPTTSSSSSPSSSPAKPPEDAQVGPLTSFASFLRSSIKVFGPKDAADATSSRPLSPNSMGPCVKCSQSDVEQLTPYRWTSLGNTDVIVLCRQCFAKAHCSKCHRPFPELHDDGICTPCSQGSSLVQ